MAARAPVRVSEQFVAWLWRRQLVSGPLVCDDGRIVQVVFPGRTWGEGQPDFQGALIAWPDGRLERGDVEIHVGPRDWKQHRHQHDPAYRQVILHVTLSADSSGPTLNVLGQHVPTLVLESFLAQPLEQLQLEFECDQALSVIPCEVDSDLAASVLERAGLRRFADRADRFEGDLSMVKPIELLWRGVARALGYTRNAAAMTHLAQRISFADVSDLIRRAWRAEPNTLVFGALLGAAGLLPSQRGMAVRGLFAEDVERAWAIALEHGWQVTRDRPNWETRRIRPGNHPVRRLAALAILAVSFERAEPLGYLARLVMNESRPARDLVSYFQVQGPGREWGSIVDLDGLVEPPVPGLVGRGRASEVVINAVLPLLHALGRFWDNRDLERTSLEVYRTFPRTAPNRLVRGMAEQIAGTVGLTLASTACRQQGLLHIFRTTCEAHACEECLVRDQRSEIRGQGNAAVGAGCRSYRRP
jgi:hypothetical protein